MPSTLSLKKRVISDLCSATASNNTRARLTRPGSLLHLFIYSPSSSTPPLPLPSSTSSAHTPCTLPHYEMRCQRPLLWGESHTLCFASCFCLIETHHYSSYSKHTKAVVRFSNREILIKSIHAVSTLKCCFVFF